MNTFLKLGLVAAAALTVLTVTGCAGDSASDEASSESDVTSRGRPAEEGDVCGSGFTGIPIVCADGLDCKKERPSDQLGRCAKALGGDGDSCGRGLPACAPTFICVIAPDDRGGHCEPTAFGAE